MKKVLLIYSTNSGGTFAVAQIIQEILAKDFDIKIQNALESKPEDIKNYDIVILGSPSWLSRGAEGMPTEIMLKLIDVWQKQKLSNKNFAIYGCGDDSYINFCGAVGHLEEFANSVHAKLILPSLRINGFYFELDKNVDLAKKWANELKEKIAMIW